MANLTKEQREAKAKEKQQNDYIAELEARLKAQEEDFQKKLKEMESEVKTALKPVEAVEEDKPVKAKTAKRAKKIPLDIVVPVTCNTVGGAIYISKKSGYPVEWDDYGVEEFMELSELVAMRNTDRRFFTDNWIVLGDTEEYTALELYDFLKVTQFYEKILTPSDIDTIFEMNADSIVKVISGMSKGMKATIASVVLNKIKTCELDSQSKINAFEDALNVKFSI